MIKRNRLVRLNVNPVVDLSFTEKDSPIVLGVRLVGNDVDNRIEAALIGVLDYGNESQRTVADVVCV